MEKPAERDRGHGTWCPEIPVRHVETRSAHGETQPEIVEGHRQRPVRKRLRIGKQREVRVAQKSREQRARRELHDVATGTYCGAGTERHQRGVALGATVEPDLRLE